MICENLSTNTWHVSLIAADGGTQSVDMVSGAVVHSSGVIVGGTAYQDTWETNYVVVNDAGGTVGVHPSAGGAGLFINGFWDCAPLAAVLACVWLIRRAMNGTETTGYSKD